MARARARASMAWCRLSSSRDSSLRRRGRCRLMGIHLVCRRGGFISFNKRAEGLCVEELEVEVE